MRLAHDVFAPVKRKETLTRCFSIPSRSNRNAKSFEVHWQGECVQRVAGCSGCKEEDAEAFSRGRCRGPVRLSNWFSAHVEATLHSI